MRLDQVAHPLVVVVVVEVLEEEELIREDSLSDKFSPRDNIDDDVLEIDKLTIIFLSFLKLFK